MTGEAAAKGKTVLKEIRQQRLVHRERHHAVANVSRRQHTVFAAQTAGAPAVIAYRNYSGQIGNRKRRASRGATTRCLFGRISNVLLESAQDDRETGSTAQRDYAKSATGLRAILLAFFHLNRELTARAVTLRIEKFREAGVFLQKREILIVAGMIAIFGPELDRELQVFHR